jgi:hypothetical protein
MCKEVCVGEDLAEFRNVNVFDDTLEDRTGVGLVDSWMKGE